MGFIELILLIYIVLVCGGVWLWQTFHRCRLRSSGYVVVVNRPDNHSVPLIERSKHHGYF